MEKFQSKAVEATFKLPWGNLSGLKWTCGAGPKVLCIHGMFSNAICYNKLVPLLVSKLGGTWYSLDLPGCGKSDSYPLGIATDLFQYTHDLNRVVGLLGWHDFHIMAHSAGSAIAFYLASYLPKSVRNIVLLDMVMPNLVLEKSFIAERVHIVIEKSVPVEIVPRVYTRDKAIAKIRTSRFNKVSNESINDLLERCAKPVQGGLILNNDPRFFLNIMYPIFTCDIHEQLLRQIECSVFIIQQSEMEFIHEAPPNKLTISILEDHLKSKLKIIKLSGSHDIITEEPETVAAEIERHFLNLSSKM